MTVPSSILRIEPFPEIAVALVNQVPLRPGNDHEVRNLGAELLSEIKRVALKAEGGAADETVDPECILERINPAKLAEIGITILVLGYMRRAFSVSEDRRYWRYTLACAVCCSELAKSGQDDGLLAYVAGLLHDIGRLALIAAYPDRYANLLALTDRMFASGQSFDILEQERMLFGLDHFATGAWLATRWKLPSWLIAIAGRFDDKSAGEHRALVTTVRAGTRLAHSLGFGYLQAAPQGDIRAILSQLPAAWELWKTLDQWQFAEEHMRGKIQSRLNWYAEASDQ